MEEPDISGMLEGMLGNLQMGAQGAPVEVPVALSSDHNLQAMLEDRICGLLLKDSLSMEQINLLGALLRGYKPCAR